ncbi:MAG: TonB-dependent receptor [Candidatus Omnitrophota bacterium]|jgi:iron complex outermembrane receptor protein
MKRIRFYVAGTFFVYCVISFIGPGFAGEENTDVIVVRKSAGGIYSIGSEDISYFAPGQSALGAAGLLPLEGDFKGAGGDGQADFSSRGGGFESLAVTLDGQRINDPQTGHYTCDIPMTAFDIERVDLTGPSEQTAGGAVSGGLDFRRRLPLENENRVSGSFGSHALSAGSFSFTRGNGESGARVSVLKRRSSGFREDTAFENNIVTFSGLLRGDNTALKADWGYQDKYFGACDFYTPGKGYLSDERTRTHLADISFALEKENMSFKPSFLWRRHYDTFQLDRTKLRSAYINHHHTDVLRPGVEFSLKGDNGGRFSSGAEYNSERIVSQSLGDHNREIPAFWMTADSAPLGNLSASAKARVDSPDKGDDILSAGFNLAYALSGIYSLKGAVSVDGRLPSFTELYYLDPTTAGSENLKSPRSVTYEAALERSVPGLNWQAGVFYRSEKDSIDWIKRGVAQSSWQAENLSRLDTSGLEGRFRSALSDICAFSWDYAYAVRMKHEPDIIYKYGPGYTRHLSNALIDFALPFGTQTFALKYTKKPGRDPWITADVILRRRLNKQTALFCSVSNLFNSEYQDIEGVPRPGRWIEAGCEVYW